MKIIYTDPIFPVIFYHGSLGWVKINLRSVSFSAADFISIVQPSISARI